jgi:hypothetical protein
MFLEAGRRTLESLEACSRNVGHILWSTLSLEPCLCITLPWSLTCVTLECSNSRVNLHVFVVG